MAGLPLSHAKIWQFTHLSRRALPNFRSTDLYCLSASQHALLSSRENRQSSFYPFHHLHKETIAAQEPPLALTKDRKGPGMYLPTTYPSIPFHSVPFQRPLGLILHRMRMTIYVYKLLGLTKQTIVMMIIRGSCTVSQSGYNLRISSTASPASQVSKYFFTYSIESRVKSSRVFTGFLPIRPIRPIDATYLPTYPLFSFFLPGE